MKWHWVSWGQLRNVALVLSKAMTPPAGRMVCCLSVRQAGVPNRPVAAMASGSEGPLPGTAGVAMRDPQDVQRLAEGIVIVLVCAEQGEPAARPQQPGGLAERDLRIDPVERGAGDDQVEGCIDGG